jgi:hypothetical protein
VVRLDRTLRGGKTGRRTFFPRPFPPFLLRSRQRRCREALITAVHLVLLSRCLGRASVGEEGLENGEFGGESFRGGNEGEGEVRREGRLGKAEVGGKDTGHHDGDDVLDVALVL